MKKLLGCVAALALTIAAAPASAAPTYCSAPGGNADGLTVNDVTFRGSAASDCFGVSVNLPGPPNEGNDGLDYLNDINLFGTADWQEQTKTDSATAAEFLGVEWLVSNGPNAGQYTLSYNTVGLPGLPLFIDFAVTLKASDRFAAYLFENIYFGSDGSSAGTFVINFKNTGGQIPALSHLGVSLRQGSCVSTEDCPDPNDPGDDVPEPTSIALLGLGLLGAGIARRRRQ